MVNRVLPMRATGTGAATTPIAEGYERRIEPSNNRSPATAEYPRARQFDWTMPLKRDPASARHSLTSASSAPGVNGLRRQRAAPSSSAMRRKSGAGESRLAKAYPDIATMGIAGARSWNILIDSKAAHMRHEDIDEHQVERAIVQRGEAALAAIRDRDPEPAYAA